MNRLAIYGSILVLAIFMGTVGYHQGKVDGYKKGYEGFIIDRSSMSQSAYKAFCVYGSISDTPWRFWSIEEKMYLCAYASSGSKLNKQDLAEITKKYGSAN